MKFLTPSYDLYCVSGGLQEVVSSKEESERAMDMPSRRSERIKSISDRTVVKNAEISSDSELESVGGERTVRRKPVARGRGRGRGSNNNTRQPRNEVTSAPSNTNQGNTANTLSDENINAVNAEMSVSDLKVTLKETRDEITSFMQSVTGVLCAIFGVLTLPQITEIENANSETLKDDALFNKCINQAKSSVAIRGKTYKDALVDENNKKKTKPSERAQSTPVRFAQGAGQQGRANVRARAEAAGPLANAQTVGDRGVNQSENSMNQSEPPSLRRTSAEQRDNNWLKVLDDNRKYNLILSGIYDTNNKNEDNQIVDGILETIGCAHRIAQKFNIIRLGAKRKGKNRLLMVCFSDVEAVKQVLSRSPNLCKSALYGHIYVKRDLPRNQRPSANQRSVNVFAEAERAGDISETPAARDQLSQRVHSSDADDAEGENSDGLSDIDSPSDFTDIETDQDRSSDSECDTLVESDVITWDELSREENDEEGGSGGTASLVHTPRFTSTASIVLMHTQPTLETQGAAASENPVPGEINPIETVPSGNDEIRGGGVTG